VALLVAALSSMVEAGMPSSVVRLGEVQFRIPDKNLNESLPWWLSMIPGLRDDQSQVNLVFRKSELQALVPGYRGLDVFATLTVLNDTQLAESQAHQRDLQRSISARSGPYGDADLEPIGAMGLFRVYTQSRRRVTWDVVKSELPSSSELLEPGVPVVWLASCTELKLGPDRMTSCLTSAGVEDVELAFYLGEDDLVLVGAIQSALLRQVDDWRRL
jgi:hypothetical protein